MENNIETKYNISLPLYFDAYLKQEAKSRHISLKRLVSNILTVWITADKHLEEKLSLPDFPQEAHKAWVEHKQMSREQQKQDQELEARWAEVYADRL